MPLGLRMQSGKLNERLLGKGAALKITPKLTLSATVLLFSRCVDGLAASSRPRQREISIGLPASTDRRYVQLAG